MDMAIVDRAQLEQALRRLQATQSSDANVRAAVDTLEHALNGAEARTLLTTAETAEALGVRSVNTVKYWVKTGYIHGVKRNERTMIPLSEIERIASDDRVRRIRSAGELDDATRELGRPMTDDEMQNLEAARPGRAPWAR